MIVNVTSTAEFTVTVTDLVTAPYVAVIETVPCFFVVTSPAGDTAAVVASDVVQFTRFVKFCVVPSE